MITIIPPSTREAIRDYLLRTHGYEEPDIKEFLKHNELYE